MPNRRLKERRAQLLAKGVPAARARGIALLESRIARWPAEWGDQMVILIHGDFAAPRETVGLYHLGITIEPGEVRDSILKSAACVVQARVTVRERTVAGVIDAANRITLLLGVFAASVRGGASAGWWCHLTHGAAVEPALRLTPRRVVPALEAIERLPREVGRRVRAAIYWMDEPRPAAAEAYRIDILHRFANCWNGFECMVDAVYLLKPAPELSRHQKLEGIRSLVAARGAAIGPADIAEAYLSFVEPGFAAKASHALKVCFAEAAGAHIERCFLLKPERERLANLRDAIRSGKVDAESLKERVRIEDKLAQLETMVFGMLARLVPIEPPAA